MNILTWLVSRRCWECGIVHPSVQEYGYADWQMCQKCKDKDNTGVLRQEKQKRYDAHLQAARKRLKQNHYGY